MSWHRRLVTATVGMAMLAGNSGLLILTGCGPMTKPMVERLDEETQRVVDESWKNIFTPPQRVGRMLLLDVVLYAQLYQMGIDQLNLMSVKHLDQGVVIMELRYDRSRPPFDEFSVRYLDKDGQELRRERYSREEIESRHEFLSGWYRMDADINTEEFARRQEEMEARIQEISAATRPATR